MHNGKLKKENVKTRFGPTLWGNMFNGLELDENIATSLICLSNTKITVAAGSS